MHYGVGEAGKETKKIPFHVGYRTPDEICFTRNSTDTLDLIRTEDYLYLNRSLLKPGNRDR